MRSLMIVICWCLSLSLVAQSEIIGEATPIELQNGENVIQLQDYFLDANVVSVKCNSDLPFTLSDDKSELRIKVKEQIQTPLSNLEITTALGKYDILVKSPTKIPIVLKLKDNGYDKVKIKGEMNSWNPNTTPVTKDTDGDWASVFDMNPGLYQYKYVIDGKEVCDPMNQDSVSNGIGGYNSLMKIEGGDPNAVPQLSTFSFSDKNITLESTLQPERVYCYCQNQLVKTKIKKTKVQVNIPKNLSSQDRSQIRCYATGGGGVSNDIVIPLSMGNVITSGTALNRHDYRSQIMYFTLIDRFNNGDMDIDDPVDDERLRPLTNYMGGDLEGITQKIESGYFDSLQINSLWLSPITQNPLTAYQEYIEPQYYYSGYHGYWPISSSQVDHRFGDDESLQRLVDVAHAHDINILLDYVTNHVHEEHPLYQAHPEYATQLILSDSTENLRLWDEQRLTTWFDTFLPSLEFSNPDVIDTQVDSTVYWLKKFGLDGYRHDATKHIPREFWIALTKRLKEDVMLKENRSIYQIGETYGSRDLIKSYISSGQLDAQFDFNLYFDAREVFAKDDQSFERLWASMNSSLDYYGYHSMMGNITGNHDQARFVSLASGDVRFDEDQKMAGFEREIGVSNEIGYSKHRMLLGFVMTIPGVPVIYYGDEIGMPGAGDPDSRRMMRFDQLNDQEEQTREYTRQLTKLRREEMPLLYGTTSLVKVTDEVLIYQRTYFEKTCYMVFNKSSKDFNFELNDISILKSRLKTASVNSRNNSVSIPPYTFDIISNY